MALAGPPVSAGDHACCLFASDDDQARLIGQFARDATKRNDRIFYLADRADEQTVTAFITEAGFDGRAMLDSGALQVLHSSQMGLEDGFDRKRQMAVWDQLVAAARDDGFRGLAASVEMSWALSWGVELDALIEYEATAGPSFASGELSALCQYDGRIFEPSLLARAGHAHPYAIDAEAHSVDYHRLRLSDRRRGELELGGEIDLSNVDFLEARLREWLADTDVVMDCREVTFMDVAGCRLLSKACGGEIGAGRLTLRNQPETVKRIIKLCETGA